MKICDRALLAAVLDFDGPLRSWLSAAAYRRLVRDLHGARTVRIGDPATAAGVTAHLLRAGLLDAVLSPAQRAALHRLVWAQIGDVAPDAPILASCDRFRHVAIACPYCPPTPGGRPRRHQHGLPGGRAELPSHRVAHCGASWARAGYTIVQGVSA